MRKATLLGLMCLLLILPAHAQNDIASNLMQPPATLILVLLDDTLTNVSRPNGDTSASTKYDRSSYSWLRFATDPQDGRGQAVIRLLSLLQADGTAAHQVGVLSFATNNETPRWLTGTEDNPFVTLGIAATNDTYTTSVNAVRNRSQFDIAGPGDTAAALKLGLEAFGNIIGTNTAANIKPVIVLITDDVPIETWGQSPWTNLNTWDTYIETFEAPLRQLATASPYNGYCGASSGVSFAVFALGAANWVNHDHSIVAYEATADGLTAGNGDYFPTLLTELNFIDPRTSAPYLYVIDPEFADATGDALTANLLTSVEAFLEDFRCLYTIDTISETDGFTISNKFTASTFYKQITITVAGNTLPQVLLPSGIEAQPTLISSGDNSSYFILRFDHDDNPSDWAGEWEIRYNTDQALSLQVQPTLDYSGIQVIAVTQLASITQNADFAYEILLQDRYGATIRNDLLLEDVSLTVNESSSSMQFDDVQGVYTRRVLGSEINTSGTFDIEAIITLRVPDEIPIQIASQQYPLASVSTTSQLNLGRPVSISRLPCTDGTYELSVPINFGTNSNLDSIASYMRVEANYEGLEAPVAVLTWDFGDNFVGTIDCSQLISDENQQTITINGVLPDGEQQSRDFMFSFVATPVPTSTPLPTANPLPTPTPLPPGPDYVKNIRTSAVSFPLNIILIIVGSIGAIGFLIVVWRSFRRNITPLHNVYLVQRTNTSETPRQVLISGIANYLPFQSRTFRISLPVTGNNENQESSKTPKTFALFTVSGRRGGRTIAVRVVADNVSVNGLKPSLNTSREYSAKEITVSYQSPIGDIHIYQLINNYGR